MPDNPIDFSAHRGPLQYCNCQVGFCAGNEGSRCANLHAPSLSMLLETNAAQARELESLKDGTVVLLPISQAHADAMVLVGHAYGKSFTVPTENEDG